MTERIDHAALAAMTIANMRANESPTDQNEVLAMAQVHASLALVEQQRIANLMTYSAWSSKDVATMDSSMVAEIEEAIGV